MIEKRKTNSSNYRYLDKLDCIEEYNNDNNTIYCRLYFRWINDRRFGIEIYVKNNYE